ncbi:MAG: Smr/MutS family protein [Desulfobacterales bacterium]
MRPVRLPITDTLDLHTFVPGEIPDLLDDYFEECVRKNILSVRIIHGKGGGVLKKRVQSILKNHPLVASFTTAPPEAGGWGATLVNLKKRETECAMNRNPLH